MRKPKKESNPRFTGQNSSLDVRDKVRVLMGMKVSMEMMMSMGMMMRMVIESVSILASSNRSPPCCKVIE